MLKIATWNVNSLRARLEHVLRWLEEQRPDILALQEIKQANLFPTALFQEHGYHSVFSGQKAYNGVAILSRHPIFQENQRAVLPGDPTDEAKRLLAVTIQGVRIVNVYIPNGAVVGDPKFDYKMSWLSRLSHFLKEELQSHKPLVLLGDFNIAPQDLDVHQPERWTDSVLTHERVRQAFEELLRSGLHDAVRHINPNDPLFSWWDYRLAAFERNWGLRIDHILVSEPLKQHCTHCRVDTAPRTWEKPSDHAPVVLELNTGSWV